METSSENTHSKVSFLLLSVFIFICALRVSVLSFEHFSGDTLNSRLSTVVALVHEGHWDIGAHVDGAPNPFEPGSVDKVMVDGIIYSSKPPVLPLLMAAEYALLHKGFNLSLLKEYEQPRIATIMTVTFIVIPFVSALVVVALWVRKNRLSTFNQGSVVLTAAFGTEMAGFSGTFNNHVPAAACLIGALYLAHRGVVEAFGNKKIEWNWIFCGLLAGLAATIDVPTAVIAVAVGLGILWIRGNKSFGFYLLGGAVPVLLHCGVMISISGSPLPVQMDQSLYWYENAYWRIPMGIDDLHHGKGIYFLNSTVGRYGVFLLYPVTIFGLFGIVADSVRIGKVDDVDGRIRRFSLLFLVSFGILLFYYVMRTNNYGGFSFGFRWLIAAVPVFLWGTVRFFEVSRSRFTMGVYLAALCVSAYSVWLCQNAPWSINEEWTVRLFGEITW